MDLFINGHEINSASGNVGKKVSIDTTHGNWHDESLSGNYEFGTPTDEFMILAEKHNQQSSKGVIYLIYDYTKSKVIGWIQAEYCTIFWGGTK